MKLSPSSKFILGLFAVLIGITTSASAQPWTKLSLPDSLGVYCLLPTTGTTIYAGTQEGLYHSEDNGDSWMLLAFPTRTVQSLATKGTMMFAGLYGGGIQRSTDNGTSWTESSSGLPSSTVYSILVRGEYIFAGTNSNGVYFSSDNGNSWTQRGLLLEWVYTLALNGSTIFAGTLGNGIFRSVDNGATWVVSDTGLANPFVRTIYTHEGVLYAGTLGGGSFRSLNIGSEWTDISKGLYSKDVRAITFGGLTNHLLIVGTYGAGAFRSGDSGRTWHQFAENLGTLNINTFATIGLKLFAGTDKGMYSASLEPSGVDEGVFSENELSIFPQPFGSAGFSVKLPTSWNTPSVRLMLCNILGEKIVDAELSVGRGEYIYVPTTTIPSGVYVLRVQRGNQLVTRTIIKE
jgi:photosystem II stability/assembly factor-like uncharacterized protein